MFVVRNMRYKYLTASVLFLTTLFIISTVVPTVISSNNVIQGYEFNNDSLSDTNGGLIPPRDDDQIDGGEISGYIPPGDDDDVDLKIFYDLELTRDGSSGDDLVNGRDSRANSDGPSDRDGDGVPDEDDAFPDDPNESSDFDGDGIGDNADLDDDNDGYLDEIEVHCRTDPLDASDYPLDTDDDFLPDCLDDDDDNDGYLDSEDDFPLDPNEWLDTDGDGIGDNADLDDDNDGWSDSEEIQYGTDPKDPNSYPQYNPQEPDTYEYELIVEVIGSGLVDPSEGIHIYVEDTVVDLTAVADDGWLFDHWSGDDLDGSINPFESIIMDSDKHVCAHFIEETEEEPDDPDVPDVPDVPDDPEEERFYLNITIYGNGTVIVSPYYENYTDGSIVNLSAVADDGWLFDNWSGDDINGSTNINESLITVSYTHLRAHET